jgi:uncharacterized protein YndB with AHSA1/START domain
MNAAASEKNLVITRTFRAPRELVWEAWADPEQLLKWFGPRHHPATKIEGEFRVGGKYRRCLTAADGQGDLWLTGEYREIVVPERLVFTFTWDGTQDTSTNVMLVTLTFEDEGANTKMTLRQTGFLDVGQGEGHNEGWNSCFDRLVDFLA